MGKATTNVAAATRAESHWFFNTLVFDAWINFDHLPICILPRESRLVFTLYGRKPNEDNTSSHVVVELGWASMQCFNFKGYFNE
jgi:phosphatidylinositol-4-phosphate 3-kinase